MIRVQKLYIWICMSYIFNTFVTVNDVFKDKLTIKLFSESFKDFLLKSWYVRHTERTFVYNSTLHRIPARFDSHLEGVFRYAKIW